MSPAAHGHVLVGEIIGLNAGGEAGRLNVPNIAVINRNAPGMLHFRAGQCRNISKLLISSGNSGYDMESDCPQIPRSCSRRTIVPSGGKTMALLLALDSQRLG